MTATRHRPLVGRRPELETLEDVWSRVERGERQVVFVGGEPGAGKTRLAAEAARSLHDNDVAVLVGTSTVDVGVPYQPFAEMLDHLFVNAEVGSLTDLLPDSAVELGHLSRHVARHLTGPARDAEVTDARPRLFEAVADLIRGLSRDRPLVLILDDLHWAQPPTLGLLNHIVHSSFDLPVLVLTTFRTTVPDRSDDLSATIADLHRLDGVRRLDLAGLDTQAIADFVSLVARLPLNAVQEPAAILRDKTGGNPFLLREMWVDLERRGGVSALREYQRVPVSIRDTLAARLSGLGTELRNTLELAAVLGDTFDLATLVAATEVDRARSLAAVDSAGAVGLIEPEEGIEGAYSFVHSLSRQAVLDQMPRSRLVDLHARVAGSLEARPHDPALVPRIAHHYLAAHLLGYHEEAIRYAAEAGRLAERSLAFEEAAMWFQRAASLAECPPDTRTEMLTAAAANHLRAGDSSRAKELYSQLASAGDDPLVRLAAAMGYEEANYRPGSADSRAVDLLMSAMADAGLDDTDDRYVRALGSLGRALAFAGETGRARQVATRAVELARDLGDPATLRHTLKASLWHGLTPDAAEMQRQRSAELCLMAKEAGDGETVGIASYFMAMASYISGRPGDLEAARTDLHRGAQQTGQGFFGFVAGCVSESVSFMRGRFTEAERQAADLQRLVDASNAEAVEGTHGVQIFMIRRETGALHDFAGRFTGRETFEGRWVPGLLALYVELGIEDGITRALRHVMGRDHSARTSEGQWPMELVFMVEGALALEDVDTLQALRPFLTAYQGKNIVGGQFVAPFGSADRYLARIAALDGHEARARWHFEVALDLDRRMRSVVHEAETLARFAVFSAEVGDDDRARVCAQQARDLAEPIGQRRVLSLLESMAPLPGPMGLSDREIEVLRLLADGLSNREIGERLYISSNTAASHVRNILTKTGAANRTQAAMFASDHELL